MPSATACRTWSRQSKRNEPSHPNEANPMNIALRIYRWLAAAFPHEFKLAFGDEMMQAGEDTIAYLAKRHGVFGVVRLIADLLLRLPVEYLNEMRRDLPYAARNLMKS